MVAPAQSLEVLRVASPCPARWDEMKGDDRVRYCGECQLHVYNISGLSRDEAQQLVSQREGRLCIRMLQRADGTVITRDCPVGLRALRLRAIKLAAGTCALAAALVLAPLSFGRRAMSAEPGPATAPHATHKADWFGAEFRNWLARIFPIPAPAPPEYEIMGDIALPEEWIEAPPLEEPVPLLPEEIGEEA